MRKERRGAAGSHVAMFVRFDNSAAWINLAEDLRSDGGILMRIMDEVSHLDCQVTIGMRSGEKIIAGEWAKVTILRYPLHPMAMFTRTGQSLRTL